MKRPMLAVTVLVMLAIVGIWLFAPESADVFLKNQQIRGVVDSTVRVSEGRSRFVLKTIGHGRFSQKVMTTVYADKGVSLAPGDVISVKGTLKTADGKRNPGGFNDRLYLKAQGISQVLSVSSGKDVQVNGAYHSPYITVLNIKSRLIKTAQMYFSPVSAQIITGILLGETGDDTDLREAFSDAGIAHVLAVSGLHVGVLCAAFAFVAEKLKIEGYRRLALGAGVLLFYVALTGFTVSAVRAALMFGLPALAETAKRHADRLSILCVAACIILVISPMQLFTAGFQMSFGAVLAILFLYEPILFRLSRKLNLKGGTLPHTLISGMLLTLVATFGVLPATLYHFQNVNLVGLLGNLIILPLVGMLLPVCMVLLPIMAIFPTMAPVLAILPELLATGMFYLVKQLSVLHFMIFYGNWRILPTILIGIVLVSAAGYIDFSNRQEMRVVFAVTLGTVCVFMATCFLPKPLEVIFLDVDNADACLVTDGRHHYLIDGGGYENIFGDTATQREPISERVLLPALYAKGITHLDGAFISHDHADHAQGIEELSQKMPIDRIYVTTKYHGFFMKQQKIPVTVLCAGSTLQTPDKRLTLSVLWPDNVRENTLEDEQNEASMILKLTYGKRTFLFTGDAGQETEDKLSGNVQADVLKVGHHGSNTASSKAFLKKVSPKAAVISVGRHNLYGHPTPQVLDRLNQTHAKIYRTDEQGAVIVTTDGNHLTIQTMQSISKTD